MKAVITAAAKNHRHLALQTVTDPQGFPTSILRLQVRDLLDAGIETIGIVIHPGDEALFAETAGDLAEHLVFIPQENPLGYGDAILRAESFVGKDPFLLTIGDHLFVSDHPERNCIEQVLRAGAKLKAPVSAVQATPEADIARFGVVGGSQLEKEGGIIRIQEVIEKPTPTLAEQRLIVSGLRAGYYYAYFGIHYLTPAIFGHLGALIEERGKSAPPVNLTDAVNRMLGDSEYYAFAVKGRRFDLEARFGLLQAQLAVALRSPHRDSVLTSLIELIANP